MNRISCNICLDLIPLVNDDIASEDSRIAVIKHIEECESCREFYDIEKCEEPKINDNRVISKMKRQIYFAALISIIIGAILGIVLTDGIGMFYNILIMPIIGVIGYFAFSKKSYYVPLALFMFIYIYLLIKFIGEGMFSYTSFIAAMLNSAYWALIYSGLCCLGILIGTLLKIAFRKEG